MSKTTASANAQINAQAMGLALVAQLKAFITQFITSQLKISEIDVAVLTEKLTAVTAVLDGDPASEGMQAFNKLISDITGLKASDVANTGRLRFVENALETLQQALDESTNLLTTTLEEQLPAANARLAAVQKALDELNSKIIAQQEALDRRLNELESKVGDATTESDLQNVLGAFAGGMETALWAGTEKPDGLPPLASGQRLPSAPDADGVVADDATDVDVLEATEVAVKTV